MFDRRAMIFGGVSLAAGCGREKPQPVEWLELSIGEPTGENSRISTKSIDSEGITLKAVIAVAHDIHSTRVVGPKTLDDRYSFLAVAQTDDREEFRALLRKLLVNRFQLTAHRETRKMPSYVVRQIGKTKLPESSRPDSFNVNKGVLSGTGSFPAFVRVIQGHLGRPTIDETGLKNNFAYELSWQHGNTQSLISALAETFSLKVTEEERDVEVLVVDRLEKLQSSR